MQEAQDAAIDVFSRLMQDPDRARVVLMGRLRDEDGSWIWSTIREQDWTSLVPGVHNEVGVFETPGPLPVTHSGETAARANIHRWCLTQSSVSENEDKLIVILRVFCYIQRQG